MSKRKCVFCGERFKKESGIIRGVLFFCCSDHLINYASKNVKKLAEKQRAKERKEFDAETRKRKKKIKDSDYKHQFDLTKKVIQKWVAKVRDADKPCISCETVNNVQYCGGHYRTAGGNPELALDTRNIHKQCNKYCNLSLSGNIYGHGKTIGYKQGLINRYGVEFVEGLHEHRELNRYTVEQLKSIRKYYNKLIRDNAKEDCSIDELLKSVDESEN